MARFLPHLLSSAKAPIPFPDNRSVYSLDQIFWPSRWLLNGRSYGGRAEVERKRRKDPGRETREYLAIRPSGVSLSCLAINLDGETRHSERSLNSIDPWHEIILFFFLFLSLCASLSFSPAPCERKQPRCV